LGDVAPDVGSGGESTPFVGPDDGTLVVYFGYTYCPDVCLTTLSEA
jgi:cytochrome oxidase Cu insertion factor (SCO1/SenC/PrrC family)